MRKKEGNGGGAFGARTPTSLVHYRTTDGLLTFLLEKTRLGLLVRRERLQGSRQVRLLHVALFADSRTFERWLDSDLTRFDYPALHLRVRREGSAFLEGETGASSR